MARWVTDARKPSHYVKVQSSCDIDQDKQRDSYPLRKILKARNHSLNDPGNRQVKPFGRTANGRQSKFRNTGGAYKCKDDGCSGLYPLEKIVEWRRPAKNRNALGEYIPLIL